MFLLFGFRTVIHQLGHMMRACPACGNTAAQVIAKRVTKFTLFFIPLFPVRTRYGTQCTYCGASYAVSRNEATSLAAR
ncbi:zinc-ribbon domain-containing protein [Sphaerisporangium sp. TRM90804]|uniref:zinc-ribbon domain-containing protein n=1 Tax=Sphaerisporangium sp. TRM90804 TaxID=3031113 RepID=UPI00244C09A6|nr:zinc-ribbon domain-containing protein [Sphaerisporangium sp. TRM90804]MDH2428481.1 zinc-ribbon domain-containing protein [Sphaerisporangium sp. TRM90804]